MNIRELIKAHENVQLIVCPADLKEFALEIANEIKNEMREENEGANLVAKNEVCKLLGVTSSTLWRWKKTGFLKDIKIGHKSFYRKNDLKRVTQKN